MLAIADIIYNVEYQARMVSICTNSRFHSCDGRRGNSQPICLYIVNF